MALSDPTALSIDNTRVPVTVVTGFLGAGKTTFLNAVLSGASGGHVAVIVNEFGEAGLDHDLIAAAEDDVILMQSGCLCCAIRGDLAGTIAGLLKRRTAGSAQFDRIVIETTGLADPNPILKTFQLEDLLAKHTRLDGVVTLVDAAHGDATLDAQFEAVSQVALGDLIVLTKTDLVTPAKTRVLTDRLRDLNPTARIVDAARDDTVYSRIWGLSGLRDGASAQTAIDWTSQKPAAPLDPLANLSGLSGVSGVSGLARLPRSPATGSHTPSASESPHDSRISTVSIVLDSPIEDVAFYLWLDTLIMLRGPDILRVKGIVFLQGLTTPFVFHAVQHVFDPPVPLRNWSGSDQRSRIVVIARDITRPELQRSLDMLRSHRIPAPSSPHPHRPPANTTARYHYD